MKQGFKTAGEIFLAFFTSELFWGSLFLAVFVWASTYRGN